MQKPLGCYFQIWSPYYQSQCNQKIPIPKKPEKDNHQHQASLNWSNNKIRFSFNQPNRKRWGMSLVDVIQHLCYIFIFMTPSPWPFSRESFKLWILHIYVISNIFLNLMTSFSIFPWRNCFRQVGFERRKRSLFIK